MEITGIVKKIGETEQITDSFKKRNLVVTTEEQYPQHLQIEFVQDKGALLDHYSEGDKVTVGINLRGREWTSPQNEVKYFNSISGWRIEKQSAAPAANAGQNGQAAPAKEMPPMPPMQDDEDDDLPF